MQEFSSMGLSTPLLEALNRCGYTSPTPIQAGAIPSLLKGKDLIGIAQTGTGKTAAFALPILDHLFAQPKKVQPKSCRALILTPTRELAAQIYDSFLAYGENLRVRTTVIFGGVNQNPQVRTMARGQDVLVATPGRLLDLIQQGKISLEQLEVFVLDEADRMLDMGFINDVRRIVRKLPPKRQTLLFSATMPSDIEDLAQQLLKSPVKVEVTPQSTTVEKIDQRVLFVDKKKKPQLLEHLLISEKVEQGLVFSRTKHGANRIAKYLEEAGVATAALHGNKSQAARVRALEGFKSGKIRILVATDIAARGIDIPGLAHVFNFDLPEVPESYVHRIGRTARAGLDGTAFSFCDVSERSLLKAIERNIRMDIPIQSDHPYPAVNTQPLEPPKKRSSSPGRRRRGGNQLRGGEGGGPRRSSLGTKQSSRRSRAHASAR